MNWLKGFQGKIQLKEPLKDHTTFKIGGPADYFIQPKDCEDLRFLILEARKRRLALAVMGAGSNILAPDKGLRGAVVKLSSRHFQEISVSANSITAASGASLAQLIKEARRHSLGGIEFLAGIPGTVGGALAMNAGAWGKSIGDLVEEAGVIDYNGCVKSLSKSQCKFNYRSGIDKRYIILWARLKLKKSSRQRIENKIRDFMARRRLSQDHSLPNAGCVFKNPQGDSAGRLIDACGLKGRCLGKAIISLKHANFFLAQKGATAKDVLGLMGLAKRQVRKRFNVTLYPEIKIWK